MQGQDELLSCSKWPQQKDKKTIKAQTKRPCLTLTTWQSMNKLSIVSEFVFTSLQVPPAQPLQLIGHQALAESTLGEHVPSES